MPTEQIPLPNLSQLEYKRAWSQDDPGSWWTASGKVAFNALGSGRIVQLGKRLGLTDRPARLLVAPNTDNTSLLMIPVRDHPQAVEIQWRKSGCAVNLAGLFTFLGRFPLPGSREFHPVQFSKDEVTIDTVTGLALELPLQATATRWKKAKEKTATKQNTQQQAAKPAEQTAPKPNGTEQAAAAKES